jgi:hypothetical protein
VRLPGKLDLSAVTLRPHVHHGTVTQVIYHTNVAILDEASRNSKIGFNLCQGAEFAAVDNLLQATRCRTEPVQHRIGTYEEDMCD